MSRSHSSLYPKFRLRAVAALLGFVWLLLLATTTTMTVMGEATGGREAANIYPENNSWGNTKGVEATHQDQKLVVHPQVDLNYYVSKRRVPNGPDPIHNRRAGNSRGPPGQA